MIGLIIFLVAGIYLALWISIVLFSYRRTLRKGYDRKKAFAVGGFFFVVMYLIPFWDLIPTLVAHKYYCNTQAGFVVYKTPEKWIRENPSSLLSLEPYTHHVPLKLSLGSGTQKNDRFGTLYKKINLGFFPVQKKYWRLVDVVTEDIIAEDIDFSRGFGEFSIGHEGGVKFWLYKNSCSSSQEKAEISKNTMGKLFDEFNMTRRIK